MQLGVLVLLAILLRRKPDLLHQQADTVRSQFQGQDKLPTLVWAYGQVSCHNSEQLFACLLNVEQMTHMDLFVTEQKECVDGYNYICSCKYQALKKVCDINNTS